jgi:hypothetical protein
MSLDAPHIPLEQHGETSYVFDTIHRWFGRVFLLAIEFGKLMEREHEDCGVAWVGVTTIR